MRCSLLLFALNPSSRSLLRSSLHQPRAFSSTVTMSATESSSSSSSKSLVVDPFCFRQFSEHTDSEAYGGTVFQVSIAAFEEMVNLQYDEKALKDGYAPFCKHLFIPNCYADAKPNVLKITSANNHLLRSKYEARNNKELPVLARYFPAESIDEKDVKTAAYLDLILYSREQINKENAAQGSDMNPAVTAPWGIVSIKAQDVDTELPMNPITAMRNALGKEEGGSGIPIDRVAYQEAVDYWKDNAVIS